MNKLWVTRGELRGMIHELLSAPGKKRSFLSRLFGSRKDEPKRSVPIDTRLDAARDLRDRARAIARDFQRARSQGNTKRAEELKKLYNIYWKKWREHEDAIGRGQ